MARIDRPLAYADSSALIKLIHDEPESIAFAAAIEGWEVTSSELVLAEVPRATAKVAATQPPANARALPGAVAKLLSSFVLCLLDRPTLQLAGSLEDPGLRSLDAIHLATALRLGQPGMTFFTYDRRQGQAAAAAGFEVQAPGTR